MNNLLHFPKSTPIVSDPTTKRVKLNANITLYTRADANGAMWQYSIKTAAGIERKSCKTTDLTEATRVASARFEEIKFRLSRGLSLEGVTFALAARDYLAHLTRAGQLPGKHSNHKTTEQTINRYLIPFFSDQLCSDIKASDIEHFHKDYFNHWHIRDDGKRGKPRKPSANSMRRHESIILAIIDYAIERGVMSSAERPLFKPTAIATRVRGAFSDDEMEQILTHLSTLVAKASKQHKKTRLLAYYYVQFLLASGMRPGVEPCSLRFCDVVEGFNPPHYIINVRDGKRGPRAVVAPHDVGCIIDGLRALHCNASPTTRLFTLERGGESSRFVGSFRAALKALSFEVDGNGNARSLYSLRHTHITRAIYRGVNLSLLAANTGTSVAMIETHYSHVLHTMRAADLLK